MGHESRPLTRWANLGAFVLLAEPGAGKSSAFELEGNKPGCHYIKAREFANVMPHFWRDPVNGQRVPRVENECRDRLFGLLRPMLQAQSVVLNKESVHAGDTRADLRAEIAVDGRLRVVPIEINGEHHGQVWSAWHDQLDGRYATHPDAEGIGIYLVLWFGYLPKARTRGDATPSSASEMESRLHALIPEADRVKLNVRVLDLSARPLTTRARKRSPRKAPA